MTWVKFCLSIAVLSCLQLCSATALAIDEGNVLVLYNESSPDGAEIANYYAQVHPGVRLLGLTGVTTDAEVTADYYLSTIRPQVLSALDPSVDVIVTTKGLPLRINTAPHSSPGTYTDPYGVSRTVYAGWWKPYSSLESELTRIDTISTWEQMGDQVYWLPPSSPGYPHPSANPYFKTNSSFDSEQFGIRLTSRLDAFSVDDVKASIDRAQRAFAPPPNAAGPLHVIVDDDPSKSYDVMPALDSVLNARGVAHVYDNTAAFINDSPGEVIGYVSHGRHQASTPAGYLSDTVNGVQFEIADGAVFSSWESFNAYSFVEGENRSGQALIGEWIERGGTAAVGHVEEPWASMSSVTNEDQLFKMLLDGYTFAEAAWSATKQVSFVNTMIGDPLMVLRPFVAGDMNNDGVLNNFDIHPFLLALTHPSEFEEQYPSVVNYRIRADIDLNGDFDNFDITLFERLLAGDQGPPEYDESQTGSEQVPEPGCFGLLLIGATALAGFCAPRHVSSRRRSTPS